MSFLEDLEQNKIWIHNLDEIWQNEKLFKQYVNGKVDRFLYDDIGHGGRSSFYLRNKRHLIDQ